MSSSRSSSTTQQSTDVFNQQVGASEGATAIGAGANVTTTINTLDAQLGETAIREVGDIASDANEAVRRTAETGILSQAGTARDALDFGDTSLARVLDFAKTSQESQSGREQNFLNFARQQGELVAASRGITAPETTNTVTRAVVAIAIVAVVGFAFILSQKKAA